MANRFGSASYDPNAGGSRSEVPAQLSKGKQAILNSHVAAVNGDQAADTYSFGFISSNARLIRGTIHFDALVVTGGNDFDLGSPEFPTGLFTNGSLQPAGSEDVLQSVDIAADLDKPLWQLLGYTADPVRDIEIIMTLKVNVTSSGDVRALIEYSVP